MNFESADVCVRTAKAAQHRRSWHKPRSPCTSTVINECCFFYFIFSVVSFASRAHSRIEHGEKTLIVYYYYYYYVFIKRGSKQRANRNTKTPRTAFRKPVAAEYVCGSESKYLNLNLPKRFILAAQMFFALGVFAVDEVDDNSMRKLNGRAHSVGQSAGCWHIYWRICLYIEMKCQWMMEIMQHFEATITVIRTK